MKLEMSKEMGDVFKHGGMAKTASEIRKWGEVVATRTGLAVSMGTGVALALKTLGGSKIPPIEKLGAGMLSSGLTASVFTGCSSILSKIESRGEGGSGSGPLIEKIVEEIGDRSKDISKYIGNTGNVEGYILRSPEEKYAAIEYILSSEVLILFSISGMIMCLLMILLSRYLAIKGKENTK